MPELPEVETVRRGIEPHVVGRRIARAVVRQRQLRRPVTPGLSRRVAGRTVERVERRGKYLLLRLDRGALICHLGMSGSLRIVGGETCEPHDHVDLVLDDGRRLRLRDPRRFGLLLWTAADPHRHPLLASLGPEPLDDGFDGDRLHAQSRGRAVAVKNFIMNARVVVGVGNIYASEALFAAGIHPARPAGRVSRTRYRALADAVRQVLRRSLRAGGTTLRDFVREDGRPGYYTRALDVYGRAGEPCRRCGKPVRMRVIGQRSSFFCGGCQR